MAMRPLLVLIATGLLVTGCATLGDEPDRPIPPDPVQIRLYTEGGTGGNGVPETVRWTLQSMGAMGEWGVVTPIPEATCVTVASRWTLSIEDHGRDVALDRFEHGHFSGASPLDLMVVRDEATKKITVAEGVPEWMNGKPLTCAPLPAR